MQPSLMRRAQDFAVVSLSPLSSVYLQFFTLPFSFGSP